MHKILLVFLDIVFKQLGCNLLVVCFIIKTYYFLLIINSTWNSVLFIFTKFATVLTTKLMFF